MADTANRVALYASVGPELGPVTVDILWSLAVPPTRSALGLEQELFLLWPAALQGEARAAEDGRLGEYLSSRGFAVTGRGQIPLLVEDLYPPPNTTATERRIGSAPFVINWSLTTSSISRNDASGLMSRTS